MKDRIEMECDGREFTTPLGCNIRVLDPPEHLGPGVMLYLNVDHRFAEVYLDPDSIQKLKDALP